jgi:hypothetical protein
MMFIIQGEIEELMPGDIGITDKITYKPHTTTYTRQQIYAP